eukprot:3210156-Pleurochrysis_carterae.AAC.3
MRSSALARAKKWAHTKRRAPPHAETCAARCARVRSMRKSAFVNAESQQFCTAKKVASRCDFARVPVEPRCAGQWRRVSGAA